MSVRPLPAAVDHDVFEPLDVRLRVAEHPAHELHVGPNHHRLVGGQPGLQDRPVGGTLWRRRVRGSEDVPFLSGDEHVNSSSRGFKLFLPTTSSRKVCSRLP